MVESARPEIVQDLESAIESMARAWEAAPRGDTTWVENDPRPLFLSYLGTTAPTPWICREAVEVTLRLFPSAVSPDRSIIVSNRWLSPPGRVMGPTIQVFHAHHAEVVLANRLEEASAQAVFVAETADYPETPGLASYIFRPVPAMETRGPNRVETALGSGAEAASALRILSRLNASELGELFPVARETFQRWLSGAIEPSPANLRRLLALRRLFQEASERVGSVRSWLFSPIESHALETPYDWLHQGRLSAVWDQLLTLSATPEQRQRVVRAPYAATPPDEQDDLSDWPEVED